VSEVSVCPGALFKRPANIFYGWWIVVVSLLCDAIKHGTFNRGFTIYVIPIRNELGIGVAAISLAEMLGRLVGGILGPVAGYLTDRLGPRAMLIWGGVASGLGFILLGLTNSYLYFMVVFVGFLSLGFRSGYNNASLAAVNSWFRKRRSLAMSIVSMGNGLGGSLAPVVGLMVLSLGWRTAALISGIAILVVVVPLSFLMRGSPESMGLLPDGARADTPQSQPRVGSHGEDAGNPGPADHATVGTLASRTGEDTDFTATEAMRTPSYWILTLAVALRNTAHSGMNFLLAPVIVWFLHGERGEQESLLIAAFFVGIMSIGHMIFSPFVGWLGDSWSKQKLSAVTMVAGALAMFLLLNQSGHLWQLAVFVILLAVSESASPLAWALMGDFFGRKSFATLRGWQHLPDHLLSMSTPVWMGLIFDRTSSYLWALIPLVVIHSLSALCFWTVPKPKVPVKAT
jgi:MCP family monocarboxylic acid transporter-like MFS transporter 13